MEAENIRLDIPKLFAGGRLCLDFVNTAFQRREAHVELLVDSAALKQWLCLAEKVNRKPLCPVETVWTADYNAQVLPRALELRTALRDLILSVIADSPAPTNAIEMVNTVLRANPRSPQIEMGSGKFEESTVVRDPDGAWLVAIAEDAVDLLCHGDVSLLRQCECATCVRVFYDTTKNHKRRWCVEKCSSQTKAAAYYQRKKARVQAAKESAGMETH